MLSDHFEMAFGLLPREIIFSEHLKHSLTLIAEAVIRYDKYANVVTYM